MKNKILTITLKMPLWFTKQDYEYFREKYQGPCWNTFCSYISVKKCPFKNKDSKAALYYIDKQAGWLK